MAWETKRMKDFLFLVNQKSVSNIKVALENIQEATGVFEETDSEFEGNGIAFKQKDILYGKLRPYLRKVWLAEFEGNAVGDLFVFRNKINSYPNFLKWLFLSEDFTSKCNSSTQGAKMPRVDSQFILTLEYPLPPLSEQKRIAAYLDKQTASIDSRIALLEKKKEKYLVLRKAVINEAVTPKEGWKEVRLKDVFTFSKGLSITKEDLKEIGVPVISYGQIHSKQNTGVCIADHLIRYVDASFLNTDEKSLTHVNDFIFADTSEDLEGCGNCVYVNKEMTLFAGYHTLLLKSKKTQDNKFLAYVFNTDCWRTQIRKNVCGVKLFSITQKNLNSVSVAFPCLKEQQRISLYLDQKTGQIDTIVSKITDQIENLKVLRKCVINESVREK